MGQGEDVKIREDLPIEIQEGGEIYFFYRPKVNREEAHGPHDVQRMYIVLRPESGEKPVEAKQASDCGKEAALKSGGKAKNKDGESSQGSGERGSEGGHGCEEVNIEEKPLFRLLVIGKKSLPNPDDKGRPFWGFVELVTTDLDEIKTALKAEDYETATRGRRKVPMARAAGEGVYRMLRHKPSKGRSPHTHLIYKLELPLPGKNDGDGEEPPPVQEAMNIEREGSFVVQVRNPEQAEKSAGGFPGVRRKRKAAFPAHLQGEFGGRRFAPADPPDFLNYEGCEFLLVAAAGDVAGELGVELRGECGGEECSDVLRDFGDVAPATPLLKGVWA